jgi:hypothetical protein
MNTRRKVFIGVAVILSLIVLAAVVRHYQLRFAVARYVAQLKARGEPTSLADLLSAPTPPDQNGAEFLIQGAARLAPSWNAMGTNPPSPMRMVAPGKAMIGWAQPDIRTSDGTNSWGQFEAALVSNTAGLKLIAQIVDYPILDFNLNYQGDFIQSNVHLVALKRSAQVLSAEAMDDLHNGNPAAATKNISTMLALINCSTNDRLIISELVRMALAQMTAPVVWETLQATNITDEQLATLQRQWTAMDFIQPEVNALQMENILGEKDLARLRASSSEVQDYLGQRANGQAARDDTFYNEFKIKIEIFRWQYWWSYPDELRRLKITELFIETARSLQTNYAFSAALHQQSIQLQKLVRMGNNQPSSNRGEGVDPHFILSSSTGSFARILNRVMKAESTRQTVIAAIALKRYQIKHGYYPPDLDALTPEFVMTVPLDPADGVPLQYQRNTDGTFLLNSMNWVWPQPASADEIQAYYQRLSTKSKPGR